MIENQKADLIDLFKSGKIDGIAHQTNVERVMGKGLALTIASNFPEALTVLQESKGLLGEVSSIQLDQGIIFNATAQSFHGIGRKTNYEAFYNCFLLIELLCLKYKNDFILAVPYGIGCGLGGGSWKIIYAILEDIFGESPVTLLICKK